MTITVRELKNVRPPLRWEPKQGEETTRFVNRKSEKAGIPKEALENVVFEAQQILGRCVDPNGPNSATTGLVVGFVQSGKTLSFTTLSALAHDNDYALIVLIAGTLENLKQQTLERLKIDLEPEVPGTWRPWALFHQPSENSADATVLRKNLTNWLDPTYPKHKKRVCITVVLKHPSRMANLRKSLKGVDLTRLPTLIIDDEADQASLNTFAAKNRRTGSNRLSANYREAVELKKLFPHHSYVQYTATPQANLLVDLVDHLSPEFGELVTPGNGYVGGATLFQPLSGYVKTIPDVEAIATFSRSSSPPSSLVEALRLFLLGACAVEVARGKVNRTMMVHPSQQTGLHNDYLQWLDDLITSWRGIVATKDPSLISVFYSDFQTAYADLAKTVGSTIPTFDALTAELHSVLRSVMVREVNSTGPGSDPINWGASEYWVLVGGAKLDRGFTVEGLMVTYMPRPLATGHADSLQQRARFYGYKQQYLGYCRVFLQRDVRHAFEQYVEHEVEIHKSLERHRGKPLKEWARQFILDSSMKPTRPGVIGIPLEEFLAGGWIEPAGAHIDPACVASNRVVLDAFYRDVEARAPGSPAHQAHPELFIDKRAKSKHNILHERIPLEFIIDGFLAQMRMGLQRDEVERVAAIVALRRLIEKGQMYADVFAMAELESLDRSKKSTDDLINQVAQGKSPAGKVDRNRLTYGGDRSFVAAERVSIHLRYFDLLEPGTRIKKETRVPWFAVHIPESLEKNYLIQSETP